MSGSSFFRPTEKYGDVQLSVQANRYACCEPRADLPSLDQYESVEVAIWYKNRCGNMSVPGELGLPAFLDQDWEPAGETHFGPMARVCPYYPVAKLELLRAALRDRARGWKPDKIERHYEARKTISKIK